MIPVISVAFVYLGISKIFNAKKEIEIKSDKPIIVIDPIDTLLKYKFSFTRFSYIFYKRKYTEEFLFSLGYFYDICFITDSDLLDTKLYSFIDPLNISRYKIYTKNKLSDISRISRSNRVIHLDIKDNDLDISINIRTFDMNKHSHGDKNNLLDVANFMSLLYNMNVKDYNKTIATYKGKNFYEAFDSVQKNIYKMRNMLNPFSGKAYEYVKNKIYREKIDTYKNVKSQILLDK